MFYLGGQKSAKMVRRKVKSQAVLRKEVSQAREGQQGDLRNKGDICHQKMKKLS